MQIYLPIAGVSVNILLILAMGGGVGLLSGLFGVGGGFLMTPLLIFVGVPPAVSVGTQANQIVASSVSGVFAHMRRGNVDFRMGIVLTIGGFVGSGLGVWIFNILTRLGHIDVTIAIGYVIFLGTIGGFMLYESLPIVLGRPLPMPINLGERGPGRHTWMHGLPFKMRFRRSKLYISALLPLAIGFLVGILVATMGVGGGFIIVPAMIYLLGMPTQVVIGTSLFQIIFVTANTTLLQATFNRSVDVVLALLLLVTGVVGAQIGARLAGRFKGEQLRVMLALLVLAVAIRLLLDLVIPPTDIFSLGGGMNRILISVLLLLGVSSARADDVPLVADLSSHLVPITAGFSGTDVLLFGSTDGPGDIVVVVRGPTRDINVRRKERFGPIWVNAQSLTLHDVPSYYRMASSRPLQEFVADTLKQRYQLGLSNLRINPATDKLSADELTTFRDAMVRLKTEDGLYSEELGSVNMMSNRLFRTELHFPANVPTGTYLVEVYLFRDGAVTSAEIIPFTVSKIGIGADIYDFAENYGVAYGAVAVLLAIAAGYAASAAFRRA